MTTLTTETVNGITLPTHEELLDFFSASTQPIEDWEKLKGLVQQEREGFLFPLSLLAGSALDGLILKKHLLKTSEDNTSPMFEAEVEEVKNEIIDIWKKEYNDALGWAVQETLDGDDKVMFLFCLRFYQSRRDPIGAWITLTSISRQIKDAISEAEEEMDEVLLEKLSKLLILYTISMYTLSKEEGLAGNLDDDEFYKKLINIVDKLSEIVEEN